MSAAWNALPRSLSTMVPLIMLIAGDPMKPATNRFEGLL